MNWAELDLTNIYVLSQFSYCIFTNFLQILPAVQEKFSQVVMYDYIGFGFSDKPVSELPLNLSLYGSRIF